MEAELVSTKITVKTSSEVVLGCESLGFTAVVVNKALKIHRTHADVDQLGDHFTSS